MSLGAVGWVLPQWISPPVFLDPEKSDIIAQRLPRSLLTGLSTTPWMVGESSPNHKRLLSPAQSKEGNPLAQSH